MALGGGGPMDVAKAVALLATHGGNMLDYAGFGKVPGPTKMPIIAVPTTAGTGSEVSASSVITDEKTNFKMAAISYYICPAYVILDPELVMTCLCGSCLRHRCFHPCHGSLCVQDGLSVHRCHG